MREGLRVGVRAEPRLGSDALCPVPPPSSSSSDKRDYLNPDVDDLSPEDTDTGMAQRTGRAESPRTGPLSLDQLAGFHLPRQGPPRPASTVGLPRKLAGVRRSLHGSEQDYHRNLAAQKSRSGRPLGKRKGQARPDAPPTPIGEFAQLERTGG